MPEVFRLCDRITVLARRRATSDTFERRERHGRRASCARWSAAICRRAPPHEHRARGAKPASSRSTALAPPAVLSRRHRCRWRRRDRRAVRPGRAPDARSCSRRSSALYPRRRRDDPRRRTGRPVRLLAARRGARRHRAGAGGAAAAGTALQPDGPPQPGAAAGRRAAAIVLVRVRARAPRGGGARWRPGGSRRAGVDVPPDASAAATSRRSSSPSGWRTAPKVLLLDEPTKGVDVGAKFEIHEIIRREAARGAGLPGRVERSAGGPRARRSHPRHARRARSREQIAGADATEEAVMRLATHEVARVKKLWQVRELSTVVILVARDPVLHLVAVAGRRPAASVPQRRQRPADPEVLVDLRHRGDRRRDRDHLRRHRSRARRGDGARRRRSRPSCSSCTAGRSVRR